MHRLVLALDCGHAVNPAQIAAQVEGSVAYGLGATMFGENSVKDGRIVEANFDTYEVLRLADMPKVETVIVPTYDFWGGVGRADDLRGRAGGAQRDPRRDRQAGAHPAAEERQADGGGVKKVFSAKDAEDARRSLRGASG